MESAKAKLRAAMAAREEPASPRKDVGLGKERAGADTGDLDLHMADWAQDPALWDKIGGAADGGNLGDPVKSVEVLLQSRFG